MRKGKRFGILAWAVIIAALAFTACPEPEDDGGGGSSVTGVTVSPGSVTIAPGSTSTLTATVTPSDASQAVTWRSSDTTVATVNNGTVTVLQTATSGKTATITATSVADTTKSASCTVTVSTVTVSLNNTTYSLVIGNNVTLTATVTGSSNTSVTWSSSAPGVASVSNGLVTGVSAGQATITATTVATPSVTANCIITVTAINIPAIGIAVTPKTEKVSVNQKKQLSVTMLPADATNKPVTWKSDNPGIATVDPNTGIVTGVSDGTVKIWAVTEDTAFQDSCDVTVPIAVTGITLTPTVWPPAATDTFAIGETKPLTAVVTPGNADNQNVIWSTSAPGVATVNAGVVLAVGVGTAKIRATTEDQGFYEECEVTVKAVPVSSVTIDQGGTYRMYRLAKTTLTATVSPSNATNKNVTWSSGATSVATVNSLTGEVTAVSLGTATITARAAGDTTKTATIDITVVAIPVESITLNANYVYIRSTPSKQTFQLAATQLPDTVNPKLSVAWSNGGTAADDAVATVNAATGLVTAQGPGKVTITAKVTTVDNITTTATSYDRTATCIVIVDYFEDILDFKAWLNAPLQANTIASPWNVEVRVTNLGGDYATLNSLGNVIHTVSGWNNRYINLDLSNCNVANIGDYAFYGCINLISIKLPTTINSIGNAAFYDCDNLNSVTIPSNVSSIGMSAFNSCKSLASVTLPASVNIIRSNAFDGCKNLRTVLFEGNTLIAPFENNAFPEGSDGKGGDTLRSAWNSATTKAGTYTRPANGSTWSK